ncbi:MULTISPECIES: hypothetical protein [Paenibacillus]|uniref:hypothetical protein n=1 Tax=Paenibacillus TaxID=44249 RepID=UPI0022B90E6D|nr:hypothetical protein [Paenibacillus caseinilyticus]MCZ8522606.1 hypothetical protein [Paenibacillus caseinilyticus]
MWVKSAIVIYALLAFLGHGIYLWKRRMRRELFFSLFLLGGAAGLHLLWALHIEIPSPFDWLNALYRPVYRMMFPEA